MKRIKQLAAIFAALLTITGTASAQGTVFTYQGYLNFNGAAANGNYDLSFAVYNAAQAGVLQGNATTNFAVGVTNGIFTTTINCGAAPWTGQALWLSIGARTNGGGAFSPLTPLQPLTPSPYAITASNLTGSLPASQIIGRISSSTLPVSAVFTGSVTAAGGFAGSGASLTNIALTDLASSGSFNLATNGMGFLVTGTLPTGNVPQFVFVATNLNGAGHVDLITANGNDNTLSVLTNNGSGGFGTYATPGVGADPMSVAVVDVNNDGRLDLIAANSGANSLIVLTNNGSGYGSNATIIVGSNPYSVVAADINGDGKLDLISANTLDGSLSIYTNNGHGGFGTNATITVGTNPFWVTAADVTGNGKQDLIVANGGSGNLSVLINNGNGTFIPTTYPTGGQPVEVLAADVNGDGFLDLICAIEYQSLLVLTNKGNGTFVTASTITSVSQPQYFAVADVNGDGAPDLICANNNSLNVLLNTGGGTFALVETLSPSGVGPGYGLVAAADFNGDGKPDLTAGLDGNFVPEIINVSGQPGAQLTLAGQAGGVRLAPGLTGTPDVIAGASSNTVTSGVTGAVIAGGGTSNFLNQVSYNYISSDFASIGGGSGDSILAGSDHSVIGGGWNNEIGAGAYQSVIAGGWYNTNTGNSSVISGGNGNFMQAANDSSIGGGDGNNIQLSDYSFIGGGFGNQISSPSDTATLDVIVGGEHNLESGGVLYSFIGGGISNADYTGYSVIVGGVFNTLNEFSHFSVIAGGESSTVSTGADHAVIGGGGGNLIQTNAEYATIPGGYSNVVAGTYGFAAGQQAQATNQGAFVWADSQNAGFASTANNQFNVRAAGGARFVTSGAGLSVDGNNVITAGVNSGAVTLNNSGNAFTGSFTGNGANITNVTELMLNGLRGLELTATADDSPNLLGGATVNAIDSGTEGAVIAGGGTTNFSGQSSPNHIGSAANFAVISGGSGNYIQPNADHSFIGAGWNNSVGNGAYQTGIVGGENNTNSSHWSFIGGGIKNVANSGADYAVVGGGAQNLVKTTASYSAIGGGYSNQVGNQYATVPGGSLNVASGEYGFAAGQQAQALHQGAFVWADSQNTVFASTANDQFLVRAQGGIGLGTDVPISGSVTLNTNLNMHLSGNVLYLRGIDESLNPGDANHGLAYCGTGHTNFAAGVLPDGPVLWGFGGGALAVVNGGSRAILTWTNGGVFVNGGFSYSSDRNVKTNFEALNSTEILDRVVALPLSSWSYNVDTGARHVGPMAQDFHQTFALNGPDDTRINIGDETGVALAAIQGLNQKLEETVRTKNDEISSLKEQNDALTRRLNNLEQMVQSLAGGK